MKKFLYPVLWIIICLLFFYQTLIRGLLPIPADDIIGLYNPFRDLYSQNYPNGIPFKNPLITDPVRQQYPWRKLATEAEKKFEIPLWNPYSLSGTPLLANFQSSPLYPLNIFLLIPPFNFGWTILIISQLFLAGIFMFFYLKNQNLSEESSLLGAIIFSFCGFSIAWLEWGTVVSTGLWAPLVLLSIDKIFSNGRKWVAGLILGLSFSFLAGHLQIFFYSLVLYIFYTLFLFLKHRNSVKSLIEIIVGSILSLIIVIPQLLPTVKFISLSARNVDLNWHAQGWFIPLQHLAQFMVPDFFGNPSTLNYFGTWNYGEMIGYVGIAGLILALFSISKKAPKTLFFWSVIIISLIFSTSNIISQIPYSLNLPFISTAQPTRLIYLIDLSLSICAAFGLERLIENKSKKYIFLSIFTIVIIFGIIGSTVFLDPKLFTDPANILTSKRNLYFPALIILITSSFLILLTLVSNKSYRRILLTGLIIITILDLFRFGFKFTPFTSSSYIFPNTKILSYLQNRPDKNFRIMSLDSQIMPPNFSDVYKIQDVSGYDPLYLLRYGEFISAMQRGKPDISSPFGFNRLITPTNISSSIFPLLQVKYALTLSKLSSDNFKFIMSEGKTNLYENENVLPRTFFVSNIQSSNDKDQSIKLIYDKNFNPIKNAVVEKAMSSNYSLGQARILNYSENRVEISTQNQGDGFLVLLDTYYPSWKVYIDGKLSKLYITDYNFRGVAIPSGSHKVVFKESLL